MEYLHHFQLAEDPFRNDHLEKFQVEVPSQGQALARLDRGVRQGRGLVALVGPAGSGKTLVARRLYEELEEEVFESSMMVLLRSAVDSEWLLSRFAAQLGVEDPAEQREALIEQIYERLAIVREDGRHAVLIVDDADALATHTTLSELCALVKLEYEERRMLTIVLVGSHVLDDALRGDPNLSHHVEVRVEMQPLPSEEAASYLGQRLTVAGGDPQLLMPGAVAALHDLAKGTPGRMNILADNALHEAWCNGRGQVAKSDVERANSDLGWDRASKTATPTVPRAQRAGRRPAAAASVAETTSPDLGAPVADLDSELEAVFQPGASGAPAQGGDPQTVLMDFDHRSNAAGQVRPVPSRAAAAPTEIQLGPADVVPSAPPKDDDAAVDDLFMELIED
ncbi:MAG: ExeA family protein [Myxococcota bacterium]